MLLLPPPLPLQLTHKQAGVTLVELLVAIAIGLLVISVALTSVLVARSLSSTTSEVAQLQQKAAYAFRVIGQQVRQAGSRNLTNATTPIEKAMFVEDIKLAQQPNLLGIEEPEDSEFALSVAFQNTNQSAFPYVNGKPQDISLHRNCLGEDLDGSSHSVLVSQFKLSGTDLLCAGSDTAQPIVSGVNDFLVRYMLQDHSSANTPLFAFGDAGLVSAPQDWSKVQAVKVCLELVGKEHIDTAGATYIRCDGEEADRGNKLRVVFRNTFHLHNRAW